MTLSVSITGNSEALRISMYRTYTELQAETRAETRDLHSKIVDLIEPAIYEAVRKLCKENSIKATVVWDAQTIEVK